MASSPIRSTWFGWKPPAPEPPPEAAAATPKKGRKKPA